MASTWEKSNQEAERNQGKHRLSMSLPRPRGNPDMARSDARFSTYSGAPSLQPSLAPTLDTMSARSSSQHYHSRFSEHAFLTPRTIPERTGRVAYADHYPAAAAASTMTLSSTDPKTADLKSFANVLDKMTDERLDRQRYVMSGNKTEEVGKIALGAKLERALSRRMVGQDAIFRPKSSEKRALEVAAN